jgi:predicted TIM-barrel fold metal-dependent hydrolase
LVPGLALVTTAASDSAATVRTVLDTHQHHGLLAHSGDADAIGDVLGEGRPEEDWLEVEVASRLASMARMGIARTVLLPGNQYLRPRGVPDTQEVNDGIRRYLDRDPEHFAYGTAIAEPLYGKVGMEEIRRARHELGMIGIAYHPRFQGVGANDPWMQRHLGLLEELGMIPFVHAHGDSTLEAPLLVGKLAEAHPDQTIVVLDGFTGYHHGVECVALAERHPNLVFDTAMAYNVSALTQFIGAVGHDRLLFGSDIYSYPMTFTTSVTPAVMDAAGWPLGAVEAVLGGNLQRILRAHGHE